MGNSDWVVIPYLAGFLILLVPGKLKGEVWVNENAGKLILAMFVYWTAMLITFW